MPKRSCVYPCGGWGRTNFGSGGGAALIKQCAHGDNECYPTTTFGGVWGSYDGVPPYSIKIEAAMKVEDRIAELNLQNDYIARLWSVVGATRNGINFWTADNFRAFWLCVHATPEQRCRAALLAIENKE